MDSNARLQRLLAMLEDLPDDPELHYMTAMEHVAQGDDAAALARFEELMRVAPGYAPGYHMAGRTLLRMDRVPEARAILTRGIAAARQDGNLHAAGEMQELLDSLG